VTKTEVVAIECDRCHKVIEVEDAYEFQEVLSIKFVGGFDSIWGDMVEVSADLCMTCSHDLLKDFATKKQH